MLPATEPPKVPNALVAGSHAVRVIKQLKRVETAARKCFQQPESRNQSLPNPSKRRKLDSLQERPHDFSSPTLQQLSKDPSQPSTVFYLAYGSNLSSQTFQGRRGIHPISQTNVVVPELVMTFDLAGLPYIEPCFANTRYRSEPTPISASYAQSPSLSDPEKANSPTTEATPDYHKTRWHKGLVGVVYEVTPTDYAHIIATEGGGASYQDVLVTCYTLPPSTTIVPPHPTNDPFKAHTLYSPISPPGTKPPKSGGRFSRPDPNYAQPSARYLKLITDGADEHGLPLEYKTYLHQLQPYTTTSQKQRLGAFIFGMIWLPFIQLVFGLNGRFADKDGRAPKWLVALTGALFVGMWESYDGVFRRVFGDGERSVRGDEEGEWREGDGEWKGRDGVVDGEGREEGWAV